jgi:dolichyl-phosphate-mannose-protein mannosyltransferase
MYRDYLEDNVPYVSMRFLCGLCGLLVVPVSYMTMRGSGHSIPAALVVAMMVCYGNPFLFIVLYKKGG